MAPALRYRPRNADYSSVSPTSTDFRVLVAEDMADVRDVVCEALEADGLHVTAARDGTEALAVLDREAIDVLVTDFAMPGCDGLQVAKACKQQRPNAKVILLTAWDLHVKDNDCTQNGVDMVIAKPVHMRTLLAAVRTAAAR